MQIEPIGKPGAYRTGSLTGYNFDQIVSILGQPNVNDDPDKVRWSWSFLADGHHVAVWDWKGSGDYGVWSIYDPDNILMRVFNGERNERTMGTH